MTELPGTLDGTAVQASATLPAPGVDLNGAQPIPSVPGQLQGPAQTLPQAQTQPGVQTPQGAQGQPPVLFMPGNINPQYPNNPSASQLVQ